METGDVVAGRYRVIRNIGRKKESNLYLVWHMRRRQSCVLKILDAAAQKDEQILKQNIRAETVLLRGLSHPALPEIYEVFQINDSYFIVMEYIEGTNLLELIKENSKVSVELVLDWGIQLCDVLSYLHNAGPPVIYRDMKPSNVICTKEGKLVLVDFGTARLYREHKTSDTVYLGTAGFAAPEQYGGVGQTDKRTDIYGLGMTLYYLLSNGTEIGAEIFRSAGTGKNRDLGKILDKCVRYYPNDRYQDCQILKADLERYLECTYGNKKENDSIHNP